MSGSDKKPSIAEASPPKVAIAIYFVTLLVGVVVFVFTPKRSVSMHYENAANHWIDSVSLYEHSKETGHGFIYLPHAAILHIPFAALSRISGFPWLGDVIWRACSWILYAYACIRFGRLLDGDQDKIQWRMAWIASIVGLSSLRIGQSTLPLASLMIFCVEAWYLKRFHWATVFIALAIGVKPLGAVLAILLFAISPPMRWRLILGGVIGVLFPFCFQSPNYVWTQYRDCFEMMTTASTLGNDTKWAQLFGMLEAMGISVHSKFKTLTRGAAAAGVFGLVYLGSRKLKERQQAILLYTWTAIYLMLFNPRTENSTYAMVGPVLGYFCAGWYLEGKTWLSRSVSLLAILAAGSYEIGKLFTFMGTDAIWLAPLCCVVMTVILLVRFFSGKLFGEEAHVPGGVKLGK